MHETPSKEQASLLTASAPTTIVTSTVSQMPVRPGDLPSSPTLRTVAATSETLAFSTQTSTTTDYSTALTSDSTQHTSGVSALPLMTVATLP